jgi:hypothetical protein
MQQKENRLGKALIAKIYDGDLKAGSINCQAE